MGRRISRYFVGGKEFTKFTYDGNDVVLDEDSNTGITKYQNSLGIDNKLKMVTNGVSKYFLQNHLGSTTALTNPSGSVIESATYDSFGNATGNLSTRYQFTGREHDNAIGLTYYRARWYSSELGRFVSQDPIGFGGGDVNLFGYVGNRPLMFTDPKGLTPSGNFWFLVDFFLGTGSDQRTYPAGSNELEEMKKSPGADALRKDFYSEGCKGNPNFEYNTGQAAKDTLLDPSYWGDTSFQAGGFRSRSTIQDNGSVEFQINNFAGANSFFYHALPNVEGGGPFRTIYQDFHWTEPVERCKCEQ